MNDEERRKLAKAIVDEWFDRVALMVGNTIISKAFWGLILLGVALGVYFGLIDIPKRITG